MERGDVLAKPGSLQVTMMVDVRWLRMLPEVERTIIERQPAAFLLRRKEPLCKAVLLGAGGIAPGESCYAQLRFEEASRP